MIFALIAGVICKSVRLGKPMTKEKEIQRTFSSWRIWLAVLLGVSFAIFMLYRALSETHFVYDKGKGAYTWQDSNHNKKVDLGLKQEFKKQKNGDYRIKKGIEYLQEIPWTGKAFASILLAMLFMVGRDLAYMWRIRILTKKALTWRKSFRVVMIWEFASALAPGVASGSTVAMFILNREKIPLGKSTAIVIITTMMDNLFYILLIPSLFLFVSPSLLFPTETALDKSVASIFWLSYFLFFALFLFLFLSIFFFPRLITSCLKGIFWLPFLRGWREAAIQTGKDVELTSVEFKKEGFSFWGSGFLATALSWTSRYLVINAILAGFIQLRAFDHVFILVKQFVLWLFMRISPTPGGSGVAEYAFGELMGDFSASLFLITTLAILWRLLAYFPYLLIGAFLFPRWIKATQRTQNSDL